MTNLAENLQNGGRSTPLAPPLGEYVVPEKRILSKAHLAAFERSPAHKAILGFIDALNASVVGKKLSDVGKGNEVSYISKS